MKNKPLGALTPIVARKRQEVAELHCGRAALWASAERLDAAPDIVAGLRGGRVIAEMKRRSPSGGGLRADLDPAALARDYAAAGAAAISVLTDGPDFGGSLGDLAAVAAAVPIPVLRKDFIVDPIQIAEARVVGADWVLLIVAILDDRILDDPTLGAPTLGAPTLDDCLAAVDRCGAQAIVEVHNEAETQRALAAGARCVGINNRNLATLTTDLGVFARLRRLLPPGVVCIAESGVRSAADVTRLVSEGADAVLVGESLMRAAAPRALCEAMVAAARAAA